MKFFKDSTIFLCLILTGICFQLSAVSIPLSLEQAREAALENNRIIKKAQLDILAARKKKAEITAIGLPQLTSSLEYTRYIDKPVISMPAELFGGPEDEMADMPMAAKHNATFNLTGTQLIFSGSYIVALQTSRIYLSLSEQAGRKTEQEVIKDVTDTYYLILVAEENVALLDSTLQNLRRISYEISELFIEGFIEQTEKDQIQISVNQMENLLNTARSQLTCAFDLIKYQTGMEFDLQISLTDNLEALIDRREIAALLQTEFNPENTVAYQLLTTSEKLSGLNLKNEWSSFLPQIAAFGSVQSSVADEKFAVFETDRKWKPVTIWGVKAEFPLFTSGSRLYKIQQAKIERDKLRYDKKEAYDGLKLQFTQAHIALNSNFTNYKIMEENLRLAQRVFNMTLEKYREGVSSNLDLIQNHNQFLQAEADYIDAKSKLMQSKNQIELLLNRY